MKNRYFTLYSLLFTFCFIFISCTTTTPYYRYQTTIKNLTTPPDIQVLLTSFKDAADIRVTVNGGYQIYCYGPNRARHFLARRILAEGVGLDNALITADGNDLKMKDVNLSSTDIVIKPTSADTIIKIKTPSLNRSYRGAIRINLSAANQMSFINILDLESYLYGVIGSEMDLRYPDYALSSQAIASRTFAFFRIKQNHLKQTTNNEPASPSRLVSESERAGGLGFDLTDDIYSQVYRGEERINQKAIDAVDSTRGVILSFNGKLVYSIFHDTCGGATEPGDLVFQLTLIPPLSGRTCGFCYHSRFNNWSATFTESEITQKLKLEGIKSIEEIIPVQKGPGGHIVSIGLKVPGRSAEIIMNAQDFRIALDPNKLRSTMFKAVKKGDSFEFTGHGWGHAVGMCQEGANGMSLKDFNTLQILEYYYPESHIVKIY